MKAASILFQDRCGRTESKPSKVRLFRKLADPKANYQFAKEEGRSRKSLPSRDSILTKMVNDLSANTEKLQHKMS